MTATSGFKNFDSANPWSNILDWLLGFISRERNAILWKSAEPLKQISEVFSIFALGRQ